MSIDQDPKLTSEAPVLPDAPSTPLKSTAEILAEELQKRRVNMRLDEELEDEIEDLSEEAFLSETPKTTPAAAIEPEQANGASSFATAMRQAMKVSEKYRAPEITAVYDDEDDSWDEEIIAGLTRDALSLPTTPIPELQVVEKQVEPQNSDVQELATRKLTSTAAQQQDALRQNAQALEQKKQDAQTIEAQKQQAQMQRVEPQNQQEKKIKAQKIAQQKLQNLEARRLEAQQASKLAAQKLELQKHLAQKLAKQKEQLERERALKVEAERISHLNRPNAVVEKQADETQKAPKLTTQTLDSKPTPPKPMVKMTPVQTAAQPKVQPAQQETPAKKGKVAALVDFFNKITHPYSKIGGNIAGTSGNIRQQELSKPAPNRAKQPEIPVKKLTVEKKPVLETRIENTPTLADDYLLAKELQSQFDQEEALRRQRQIDEDQILAAKLQIEEEVGSEIAMPARHELNKPSLTEVAGDIYNRQLAEMFRALKPKPQLAFPKPDKRNEPVESPAKKAEAATKSGADLLVNFGLIILVQTYSLEMAIVGNNFIMREVQQSLAIGITRDNKNQLNIDMAFASQLTEVAANQKGLFAHSMFTQQQANYQLRPGMDGLRKQPEGLLDDFNTSRPGMKSR